MRLKGTWDVDGVGNISRRGHGEGGGDGVVEEVGWGWFVCERRSDVGLEFYRQCGIKLFSKLEL